MGHKQGMTPQSRRVFGFIGRFLAAWLAGLAILATFPGVERWAVHATIESLGLAGHMLRVEWAMSGTYVGIGGVNLEIITDCTPVMPALLLWSAMVAYPAPRRWKLAGIATGGVTLWVYNVARVLVLAIVLQTRPTWFEFVHIYLWQTFTLLIVLAMFAGWVRLLRTNEVSP